MSIRRSGSYGSTDWVISLSCGHSEHRKRKPPAKSIGCAACVNDERIAVSVALMPSESTEKQFDEDSRIMLDAALISAGIAARLGIEPEMVDVRVSAAGRGLEIQGASVWLPPETLKFFI